MNKNTDDNKDKKRQQTIWYVVAAFLFIYAFSSTKNMMTTEEISYNKFLTMIENKEVQEVVLSSSEIQIIPKENEGKKFEKRT